MADICHNTSGLPGVTRRRLLQAAPAAMLGAGIPAFASADPSSTAVTRAYIEWKIYRDWLEATDPAMPDEQFDALVNRRHDIENAMFEIPSTDLRDAALKLTAFTDHGNDFSTDGNGTGERLLRELGDMALGMIGGAA